MFKSRNLEIDFIKITQPLIIYFFQGVRDCQSLFDKYLVAPNMELYTTQVICLETFLYLALAEAYTGGGGLWGLRPHGSVKSMVSRGFSGPNEYKVPLPPWGKFLCRPQSSRSAIFYQFNQGLKLINKRSLKIQK